MWSGDVGGWSRILALSLVGLLSLMPLVLNPYWVFVLGYGLTLAIACLGVNLLLGHTGLLSLGHAAYFGIGAYAGAFLFTFGDVSSLEVYLASGIVARRGWLPSPEPSACARLACTSAS